LKSIRSGSIVIEWLKVSTKSNLNVVLGDSSILADWISSSKRINPNDLVLTSCRSDHKEKFRYSQHIKIDLTVDSEVSKFTSLINQKIEAQQYESLNLFVLSATHSTNVNLTIEEIFDSINVNTIAPWRIISQINNLTTINIQIFFISSMSYINPFYPNKLYSMQKKFNSFLYQQISSKNIKIRIAICGPMSYSKNSKLGPVSKSKFVPNFFKGYFLVTKETFVDFLDKGLLSNKHLLICYLPKIWRSKTARKVKYE